jgi:Carboxypeptidase regulatory-like domain/TonB-dependent Receptor Plug Domain
MSASTRLAAALLLSFAASCSCLGQTLTTARIAGTVRDTTGAVIVNAQVSAQNTATGETHTVITDANGDYVLTSISPGTYQVTISAARFASVMYSGIRAGIDETVTVNVVLKVASADSTVTVTDVVPPVQSVNSEISTSIDQLVLSSAPLPTRNFLQLVATVPGVNMPLTDNRAIGRNSTNFSLNGARNGQNNLEINGVDANDASAHDLYSVAIPAPESISEVAVKTSMYDANVGGAGGSLQVITKSGTNRTHGNVYEYFRNTALNANDPDLKAVGLGPPVLRRNVYGVTLGGPIRKDRALFFLSYQGTRDENGATDQSLYKSVFIAPVPQNSPGLTNDHVARSHRARIAQLQTSRWTVPDSDPTSGWPGHWHRPFHLPGRTVQHECGCAPGHPWLFGRQVLFC